LFVFFWQCWSGKKGVQYRNVPHSQEGGISLMDDDDDLFEDEFDDDAVEKL